MSRSRTLSRTFTMLSLVVASVNCIYAQHPEQRLSELNLALPKTSKASNNYTPALRSGNLIYLSGKGPLDDRGNYITGKLGREINTQQGVEAARRVALAHLAELNHLSKIYQR